MYYISFPLLLGFLCAAMYIPYLGRVRCYELATWPGQDRNNH
ncbi:hypothetical protein GMOD_00004090 [Pyrenophora seminiperda CCB06]|uniref:Uncharacterized protein n=1 Tax=Pyrenophora seminiperda CCB06 TaxID=1302712 RepID=A0A3M7M0F2_9PLEO|nr:hypothetical protein GMOD_00004090 [Pyrenophora seminiperda CCB06]